MEAKKERIQFIDIFKGLGILLMVAGHVKFGKTFNIYIHAFHMPMFFFISGFLYKSYDLKKFLSRKFDGLIKPYLGYGMFRLLYSKLMNPSLNIGKWFEGFVWFNNRKGNVGALWFLTSLFFADLIFYSLERIFGKYKIIIPIFILTILEFTFHIRLPLSIDSAIFMLLVFWCGYIFKDFAAKIVSYRKFILAFVLPILLFFTIMYNGYVNIRLNQYANPLLFYFNAILMSVSLFYFSQYLEKLKVIKPVISYIGKNSLVFLCLNQFFISILKLCGVNEKYILLLLTLICLAISSEIINRIKIPVKSNK